MSVAEAFTDMAPSPRVEITIDAADVADADAITVWQVTELGQHPVRDAELLNPVGGQFVVDYEVPFRRPVSYKVQKFAAGLEVGWALDLTVNVAYDGTVISDPQIPDDAIAVIAEHGFAATFTRSRVVQRHVAGGRTVALMGPIGLYEGVPLRVITESFVESQRLRSMLSLGTVLVRSSIPSLPPTFYCVIPDVPEMPFDYRTGGSLLLWNLVADEVSVDNLPILKATVTWERIKTAFATWNAVKAMYPTWQAIIRDPPPEA